MPPSGGDPISLTLGLPWKVSPTGAAVACNAASNDPEASGELLLSTPGVGEQPLVTSKNTISDFSFDPTGDGLLYIESDATFSYVSTKGGPPIRLGNSGHPRQDAWYSAAYTTDPDGCFVVYSADSASQSGAFLQPLPRGKSDSL